MRSGSRETGLQQRQRASKREIILNRSDSIRDAGPSQNTKQREGLYGTEDGPASEKP